MRYLFITLAFGLSFFTSGCGELSPEQKEQLKENLKNVADEVIQKETNRLKDYMHAEDIRRRYMNHGEVQLSHEECLQLVKNNDYRQFLDLFVQYGEDWQRLDNEVRGVIAAHENDQHLHYLMSSVAGQRMIENVLGNQTGQEVVDAYAFYTSLLYRLESGDALTVARGLQRLDNRWSTEKIERYARDTENWAKQNQELREILLKEVNDPKATELLREVIRIQSEGIKSLEVLEGR